MDKKSVREENCASCDSTLFYKEMTEKQKKQLKKILEDLNETPILPGSLCENEVCTKCGACNEWRD